MTHSMRRIVLTGLACGAWSMAPRPVAAQGRNDDRPVQAKVTVKRLVIEPAPARLNAPMGVLPPPPAIGNRGAAARSAQYLQQFRPILNEEYHLAVRVCRLSPDERKEVARAGEWALRKTAADWARYSTFARIPQATGSRDPRKNIQQALSDALKRTLPTDRWEPYGRELEQRQADLERALAQYYLARLDQELVLTAPQRDQVLDKIKAALNDDWHAALDLTLRSQGYLPTISVAGIEDVLTPVQKELLRRQSMSRVRQIVTPERQVMSLMGAGPGSHLTINILGLQSPAGAELFRDPELTEAEKEEEHSGN